MSATEAAPTPNPAVPAASSASSASSSTTAGSSPPRSAAIRPLGASDIALILARITHGLLRAEALEARIIRDTARLDAEPAPPRAPPTADRRPAAPATEAASSPEDLPAHARADRRRGPPPPDRRRHRRHLPRPRHHAEPSAVAGAARTHHPPWRQPGQSGEGHPRSGVSASRFSLASRMARGVPAIPRPPSHRPALIPTSPPVARPVRHVRAPRRCGWPVNPSLVGRDGTGQPLSHSAACATSSPSRTPRTTYSAATLIASIMLTALALPVPAMSKAVP